MKVKSVLALVLWQLIRVVLATLVQHDRSRNGVLTVQSIWVYTPSM